MRAAPFNGSLHPHWGVATLTYIVEGGVTYIDPNNIRGTLSAGGVEWMQAGRGLWHGGGLDKAGRTRGFQLCAGTRIGPERKHLPGPRRCTRRWPGARPARQLRRGIERHRVPVADQLSRSAPEGGRPLALRATGGPHRPLGRRRIGCLVGG